MAVRPFFEGDIELFKVGNLNLDANRGFYVPGDTVTGEVRLITRSDFVFHLFSVRLIGESYAECTEFDLGGEDESAKFEKYIGFDQFVNVVKVIYPGGVMAAGTHVHPFSFSLPVGGPSTVKGHAYGSVSYKIRAEILQASAIREFVGQIPVRGVLLLDPCYLRPQAVQYQRWIALQSGCCVAGGAQITMIQQKVGFLMEEEVAFTLDIFNKSSTPVRGLQIRGLEVATWNMPGATDDKTTSKCIFVHNKDGFTIAPQRTEAVQISFKLPQYIGPSIRRRVCTTRHFLEVHLCHDVMESRGALFPFMFGTGALEECTHSHVRNTPSMQCGQPPCTCDDNNGESVNI